MRAAVTPEGSGRNLTVDGRRMLLGEDPGSNVDWSMWRSMATVELWEALALSVDRDPAHPPPPSSTDQVNKDYERRLRIAESHLGPGGTLQLVRGASSHTGARVSLPVFAAWALSLGWNLPDAFPRAVVDSSRILIDPRAPHAERAPAPPTGPSAAESVPGTDAAAPLVDDWKMRVQAEAAAHWQHLRKLHCNPTKHGILPHLAKWCRENNIRTAGPSGIHPSEGYLKNVLVKWEPPR